MISKFDKVVTAVLLLFTSTTFLFAAKPIVLKKRTHKTVSKIPIFKGGMSKFSQIPKSKGRPTFLSSIGKLNFVKSNHLGATLDIKKTFTLTPAHPVDGPAYLIYANPVYVTADSGAQAGFKSQEGLLPGNNKMVTIRFKPLIRGKYLVELSLAGGQKYRLVGGGGQDATFGGNSNPVLVFDGSAGDSLDLKVFGTTKHDYENWRFYGCRLTLIK